METAKLLLWICGGSACVLFILQSVFWTAMRMRKIGVPKWRTLARRWLVLGIILLAVGLGFRFLGPTTSHPAGYIALLGGGMNALVAWFHLSVVAYLTR